MKSYFTCAFRNFIGHSESDDPVVCVVKDKVSGYTESLGILLLLARVVEAFLITYLLLPGVLVGNIVYMECALRRRSDDTFKHIVLHILGVKLSNNCLSTTFM